MAPIDPTEFERLAAGVRTAVSREVRARQSLNEANAEIVAAKKEAEARWNDFQNYVATCAGALDPAFAGRLAMKENQNG
jgi:hypothetical protein